MICLLFLQFISFVLTYPTTLPPLRCPDGFSVLNSQKCVKLVETPMLYQDASKECQNYSGGKLLSIHNAIDNRALTNLAISKNAKHPIWIGLNCSISSNSYCNWEDGSGTANGYNNFASGNPFVDVGNNVYMLTSGSSAGRWVSADGTIVSLNYFCEVPTKMAPGSCLNAFNGFCYTLNVDSPIVNEAYAREYCQKTCGDLVSIHSEKENSHILSLLPKNFAQPQIRIGVTTDGIGKYWSDGTIFDYSNFAYFNADIGKCSAMSTNKDITQLGQWLSNDCEEKIPFVCKRLENITSCEPIPSTGAPITVATPRTGPTPSTTMNPDECFGTHFFSGNGTIYSPKYPDTYYGVTTPCTYIITVPKGSIAQIQFPELMLDNISTVSLFSGIEDTRPFAIFNGYTLKTEPQSSTTNVLKMVFKNMQKQKDPVTRWVANYGTNLPYH